jgi:hypothetical protein
MPDLGVWGKLIMFIGGGLFLLGLVFFLGGKFLNLGKLPGDIFIQKGNFSFYFPVVTSILLSIVLTIILNLFRR